MNFGCVALNWGCMRVLGRVNLEYTDTLWQLKR